MSRLVINKTEERTICIIKNFASIELIDDTVKTIDKFGLSEFNIFDMELRWLIKFKDFEINSSNQYGIFNYSSGRYWNVSNAALNELRALFSTYFFDRLEFALKRRSITLNDIEVSFNNDLCRIKRQDIDIVDRFTVIQPNNYQSNEIVILGEQNLIHVIGLDNVEMKFDLLHCTNDFPEYIFLLKLHSTQLGVLRNFISSCLNSVETAEKFLLVNKLS